MMCRSASICLAFLAVSACCVSAVTIEEDLKVAQACVDVIRVNIARFLPGFVRVAFHDCVGGCDGCIDMSVPDNAGLEPYLAALNAGYEDCEIADLGISRADFYAKCGQVAAELGRVNAVGNSPSTAADLWITFKYGRVDCTADADGGTADKFPNPRHGLTQTLAWCNDQFGLSDRECTALLGAHTLGRARAEASGFINAWVPQELALDNDYYIRMLRGWNQVDVAVNPATAADQRWQWVQGGDARRLLLLNADICLRSDIQPIEETGQVTDRLGRIPDSSTNGIVREYAADNTLWLNEFGQAFTKMIDTGYAAGVLVEADEAAAIPTRQSRRLIGQRPNRVANPNFCDVSGIPSP